MVNSADPPTPAELAGLLSIVVAPRDKVVTWFRILNAGLVVASCVLAGDALRLVSVSEEHPPDSLLLIVLLVAASVAVGVLGELDVRNLEAQLSDQLDNTTLGHLRQLGEHLESRTTQEARREIGALARAFPGWQLLREYSALVSLQEGEPLQALQEVEDLLQDGATVHVGGMVAAAAAVESGQLRRGLFAIQDIGARKGTGKELVALWHALQLMSGHLDELIDGDEANHPDLKPDDEQSTARDSAMLADVAVETVGVSVRTSTIIDLRPEQLQSLRTLISELSWWNTADPQGATSELKLVPPGPAASVLTAVANDGALSDDLVRQACEDVSAAADPSLAETVGFAFLVSGADREALEVLEAGISWDPKRSRLHWAHAIACWRWGWLERAHESLGRALALDPDDVVLTLTRSRLEDADQAAGGASAPGLQQLLPTVRLQLTLLGLHTPEAVSGLQSPRSRFVGMLLERAGQERS